MITDPLFPGAQIHVGTHCAVDGRRISQWAHAHNERSMDGFGTICIRPRVFKGTAGLRPEDLTPTGRVRRRGGYVITVWHEYAHILLPGQGHTKAWRDQMRSWGFGPHADHYERRYASSRAAAARQSSDGAQTDPAPA